MILSQSVIHKPQISRSKLLDMKNDHEVSPIGRVLLDQESCRCRLDLLDELALSVERSNDHNLITFG